MGFDLNYLMGKFNPAQDSNFVKIPSQYANNNRSYMRKEAYRDFVRMAEAAQKDDIKLVIVSAARNFSAQKAIWEAKWDGRRAVNGANLSHTVSDPVQRALKILEYSSMPSTSRHHWGTDIDINSVNGNYFESGTGKKVYEWLASNAHKYGYCQIYSPKGADRPHGYNEEKWHWSYLPIARPLTAFARDNLKNSLISGFKGSETAVEIGVVEKYVLGINPTCF